MSIANFKMPYLGQCYYIDIKSYLWPWTEEGWNKIQGYIIRVKLIDDRVLGFCSFRVEGDDIVVSKLCVHPSTRRLGLGTELHEDLIRIAKKYHKRRLRMMLHEENEHRDFLIKRGWRAVSIEKGLFPDSLDGYLFVRKVS